MIREIFKGWRRITVFRIAHVIVILLLLVLVLPA